MTILLRHHLPAPRQMIEAVSNEMGVRSDPPPGLLIHVATETPDGIDIVDVWNSREDYEAFDRDRLAPAIAKVAAASGMEIPADMPAPTMVDAFDLVMGG